MTTRTAVGGVFTETFNLDSQPLIGASSAPEGDAVSAIDVLAEFAVSATIEPRKFGHGKQHRCGRHEDEVRAG